MDHRFHIAVRAGPAAFAYALAGGDFNIGLLAVVSLCFPTLIYYLILRAISLREDL